jgi:hypothetical protein
MKLCHFREGWATQERATVEWTSEAGRTWLLAAPCWRSRSKDNTTIISPITASIRPARSVTRPGPACITILITTNTTTSTTTTTATTTRETCYCRTWACARLHRHHLRQRPRPLTWAEATRPRLRRRPYHTIITTLRRSVRYLHSLLFNLICTQYSRTLRNKQFNSLHCHREQTVGYYSACWKIN